MQEVAAEAGNYPDVPMSVASLTYWLLCCTALQCLSELNKCSDAAVCLWCRRNSRELTPTRERQKRIQLGGLVWVKAEGVQWGPLPPFSHQGGENKRSCRTRRRGARGEFKCLAESPRRRTRVETTTADSYWCARDTSCHIVTPSFTREEWQAMKQTSKLACANS